MPITVDGTNGITNGNSNVNVVANGNVTVSVTSTANVLTITTTSLIPTGNGTVSLGATASRFANLWGLSSSAQYADLAERYESDYSYDPATVVIFGGNHEITTTTITHDPRAAGVISTKPAFLMNDDESRSGYWLPLAMTGRVPTKIRGPINKGDMVVTSDEPGVGERFQEEKFKLGCIIGKSLGSIPDDTIQVIEVVVGKY